MTCHIRIWSAAFTLLALSVSTVKAQESPPAIITVPMSQLQTLLDDGWIQVGSVVLIKDLNDDGQITPPEETRVLVEESQ